MQSQRINIVLPEDILGDLRRIVPQRTRSRFIAELIREKLQSRKNLRSGLIRSLKSQEKITKKIRDDFKYSDDQELAKLP